MLDLIILDKEPAITVDVNFRMDEETYRNLQAFIRELTYSCYRRNWLLLVEQEGFFLRLLHVPGFCVTAPTAAEQWWGGWRAVCSYATRRYDRYIARLLALTGRVTRNYNRSEPEQSPWHPNPNTVTAVQTCGHDKLMMYTIGNLSYTQNLVNLWCPKADYASSSHHPPFSTFETAENRKL